MEKQKAIADASIVAKWFLEEDSSENAMQLRDSFVTGKLAIAVPSLLFYEALNALWHSGLFCEEELTLAARLSRNTALMFGNQRERPVSRRLC
ncbi:MAG: type II toxin-antitoxin system VapC family toxin [Candidatus Bathyarchaeota archaeon]|nr:type II toxin-antitoxin system VapC family toxin [Candidatus Bathyarchaeota archaeon]